METKGEGRKARSRRPNTNLVGCTVGNDPYGMDLERLSLI